MVVYFKCPMCGEKNAEAIKYCISCGTWLQNETFPAIRIDTTKRAIKRTSGTIGSLIALAVIAGAVYWGFNRDSLPTGLSIPVMSQNQNITFGSMDIGEQFTLSQLIVNPRTPAATADLSVSSDLIDPIEVIAAFYDEAGQRVGVASTMVIKSMTAGQVTTISFEFTEVNDLSKIRQVRIEITPLSPLMLLERAADKMKNIEAQ